jgi:pyruvate formate lyase activating enzyme
MKKIKERGFLVKLDSNGTRPEVLKRIFKEKLADFISMDIKNSPTKYSKTAGVEVDIEKIKTSIDLIRDSGVGYEFRTTVVPGFHTEEDFEEIANWLKGSSNYALQKFRDDGKVLDESIRRDLQNQEELNLEKIKQDIKSFFEEVEIR